MKYKKWFAVALITTVATVALAAGFERVPKDTLKLGSGSSSDKTIEFDYGAGAANPLLRADQGNSRLEIANDGVNFSPLAGTDLFNQDELKFYEQTGNGTNYIGFTAPDSVTATETFKWPDGDGTANQVLKTDGSGNLDWATTASGNNLVSTKSANYTVTDGDNLRTALVEAGSTTFTFVDGDVTVGTDVITKAGHGRANGDTVYLTSTGTVPDGLTHYQMYFVVGVSGDDFQLADSVGGAAVDITAAAGGGTHTVNVGVTITLATAADNPNRYVTVKKISGTGWVSVDGEGAETIDGATHVEIRRQDQSVTLQSDATGWRRVDFFTAPVGSFIIVSEPNGHGSTDTHIRRFTNVEDSSGSAITHAETAANGSTFTINVDGVYALTYQDQGPAANTRLGITKNSTNLTVQPGNDILEGYTLGITDTAASGYHDSVPVTIPLKAGDIIRAQTDSGPTCTTWKCRFTITLVAKDH